MNSCTRNFYEDAVEIRRNKLIAAENGYEQVLEGITETAKTGQKAVVIGAGPAGLAAAYFLNRGGIDTTIYEKSGETGGMVRSILCHKLNQITGEAIDKDVALIEKAGVHVKLNTDVTSMDDLKDFDYVVIASGVKGKSAMAKWLPRIRSMSLVTRTLRKRRLSSNVLPTVWQQQKNLTCLLRCRYDDSRRFSV